MMTNKLMICMGCCLAMALIASCGNRNDETPKPQAYLRIDMPPHAYTLCDTSALPFTFEHSNMAQIEWKKAKRDEQWFTITYPKYKGFVFMTYKHIAGA